MALLQQAGALAHQAFARGQTAAALHPIYVFFMVLCIMMFAICFMLLLYAAFMDDNGPTQERSGTRERTSGGGARVTPPMPTTSPWGSVQDAGVPPHEVSFAHSPGDAKMSSPPRPPETSSPLVSPGRRNKAPPDVPPLAGLPGIGGTGTLCPSLVVPSGMEFVFAVPEVLSRERQDARFNVVDLKGRALSHVEAREESRGSDCGLYLQMLDKTLLAWVRTLPLHNSRNGQPEICKPNGDVFCSIARDTNSPTPKYLAKEAGSGRRILAFVGDFADKAVNIVNAQGRLVGATERKLLEFDHLPYYQVRVAPKEDAGLLLCGLLAIDKLESWKK